MKIKLFLGFLLATALLFLISCNNGISDDIKEKESLSSDTEESLSTDNTEHAYILVQLGEESAARSILPTALTRTELSYVLKGKKSTETAMSELGNWDSYEALQSMTKIELTTGSWSFSLEGLKEGVVVLTSTISKTINYGNNSLSFTMKETSTGNGNLTVSLKYPLEGIAKVTAGLFNLQGTAISTYPVQNITSTISDGKNIAQYKKTAVPKGTYILRFYLYQKTSDLDYTNTYSVVIRIAPGCNTTGIEEIENLNSIYSITYNLNDGVWEDDIYIPLSYTNYTNVELPTTLYKEGFVFGGWYTNADFSGEKVTTIPYGTDGNKTYYAKWIDEISCTSTQLLTMFEGFNKGDITVHITDVNPSYEVLKNALINTSVKITLDLNNCTSISTVPSNAFANCSNLTGINLPNTVVTIGSGAFKNDSSLKIVGLPTAITIVGAQAFMNCSALEAISFGDSLTSIENEAFTNCCCLQEIEIPDTVTTIGNKAFMGCSSLQEVTIGNGITEITSYCFSDCEQLTSIVLPENLELISSFAFANCKNIRTITSLPTTLETIGMNCFEGCSSLTTIELPNTLVSLGANAFNNCISLRSIVIPDNVTTIGTKVFNGCNNISITINNILLNSVAPNVSSSTYDNQLLKGCKNYSISIIAGTNSLADYCFYNCTEMNSIALPSDITAIGEYCFYNCTGLNEISLPSQLSSLGNSALENCSSILLLELNNDVSSIGNRVFAGCSNLRSIILSNTLKTIGDNAFEKCVKLSSIIIPDSVTTIGSNLFNCISGINIKIKSDLLGAHAPTTVGTSYNDVFIGCTNFTVELSSSSFNIRANTFMNCTELKGITMPSTIKKLYNYAFYNCENLPSIDLPDSIETLGTYVFAKCKKLSNIELPDSVTTIGTNCFQDCKGLQNIVLSNNLQSISNYLFSGDNLLTEIEMPDSIETIGQYAFSGCTNLESVVLGNSITSINTYAFENCSSLASLSIPSSITTISNYVFKGCTGFKSITFEDGNTELSLGQGASSSDTKALFCDCRLENIYIGRNLKYTWSGQNESGKIYGPFYKQNNISTLIINTSVTKITDYLFADINGTAQIVLPESITYIGQYAFCNNTMISSFNTPNLINLKNGAFYKCTELSEFTVGSSLETIGKSAFYGCYSLQDVILPKVTRIGSYAFVNCTALKTLYIQTTASYKYSYQNDSDWESGSIANPYKKETHTITTNYASSAKIDRTSSTTSGNTTTVTHYYDSGCGNWYFK